MKELVLASGNRGKLRELDALLAPMGLTLRAQGDLQVEPAEETGSTFVENAILKARHAARHSGLPALADDSGLLVDGLGGAPGVHSARYAGPSASDADNIARLLAALTDRPDAERTATFCCVLVLMRDENDPMPLIAEGRWPGRIARAPQGEGGFGYDPVFVPDGHQQSAAELGTELKNTISHRARALASLTQMLGTVTRANT